MPELSGAHLLTLLGERMGEEAHLNPDPQEQEKAFAMARIFHAAARDIREGRAGELALAVLDMAKLGTHLVGADDD